VVGDSRYPSIDKTTELPTKPTPEYIKKHEMSVQEIADTALSLAQKQILVSKIDRMPKIGTNQYKEGVTPKHAALLYPAHP